MAEKYLIADWELGEENQLATKRLNKKRDFELVQMFTVKDVKAEIDKVYNEIPNRSGGMIPSVHHSAHHRKRKELKCPWCALDLLTERLKL